MSSSCSASSVGECSAVWSNAFDWSCRIQATVSASLGSTQVSSVALDHMLRMPPCLGTSNHSMLGDFNALNRIHMQRRTKGDHWNLIHCWLMKSTPSIIMTQRLIRVLRDERIIYDVLPQALRPAAIRRNYSPIHSLPRTSASLTIFYHDYKKLR